ncbi:MAG: hypothetical protein K2X34_07900, partial [Hyphomonadaceae bacterium]|nr:hypothetical protein [Hyphomonadaceae bacterium]
MSETPTPRAGDLVQLPLSLLIEGKSNPRKTRDKDAEPHIRLAQDDAVLFGETDELFDRGEEKTRVARMRDGLGHHRRVDRDAGEIVRLQRASAMRDAQAFGKKPVEPVAHPAAPVAQVRALMRE